ncbi:CUB and sushi domain-containing protein 3 [Lates japonicus]|uniref:CUB and sushi domain-containing protein 3 n=1 Tax=Lates japonicus TaxID=270547 RepID=A0AAD3RKM6_LATJO|nr:CUB and sushi domain-containing protein 3 [Lates japonicus]GLD73796.1 CUB and sushi domain-containing protein 3 [Lates japonicus]GLD74561.1 CUB and sushi domain-containing protein 3 [Lates japonicus]
MARYEWIEGKGREGGEMKEGGGERKEEWLLQDKKKCVAVAARRLTGFQVPPPVTSTGNVFSLRLTSDFAVSAHGFKLNYEELIKQELCVLSAVGNPG